MNFCPTCGNALVLQNGPHTGERERKGCPNCHFVDFGRYSLGVGGLVVDPGLAGEDRECRVLFIQRNEEPNKGTWTIPGGYVEFDELIEAAAVREIEEETGLRCEVEGLVAFRNRVDPNDNSSYAVFYMKKISGTLLSEGNTEIARIAFLSQSELDTMEKVAPLSRTLADLAFNRNYKTLQKTGVKGTSKAPYVLYS